MSATSLYWPSLIQYIPRNMKTVFALLCFVVVIHWLIFPYPSGLLHWHCGNLTIAPVPAKQPWWIWINTSCEFIMNDCITTTKQSTTKPCAYFLGCTVHRDIKCQHDMETLSTLLALNAGNPPVIDGSPSHRASNAEILFPWTSCWTNCWFASDVRCHDWHAGNISGICGFSRHEGKGQVITSHRYTVGCNYLYLPLIPSPHMQTKPSWTMIKHKASSGLIKLIINDTVIVYSPLLIQNVQVSPQYLP